MHLGFGDSKGVPGRCLPTASNVVSCPAQVLVHAATGGVGSAAVQVCGALGCPVLGTAGSPEKRALLRAQGVAALASSRDTCFADAFGCAPTGTTLFHERALCRFWLLLQSGKVHVPEIWNPRCMQARVPVLLQARRTSC